jgi:DNA polymerase III epsilon subunit-like protein
VNRAIVFDTETTGLVLPRSVSLEKQPKIIELGYVVLEGGVEVKAVNHLVDPGEPITAEITKITGITNEQLAGQKDWRAVWELCRKDFESASTIIAHNVNFDVSMLNNDCARNDLSIALTYDQICTVQEFSHLFGHRPKLTELYKHFVGEELAQTHRALDDVRALVKIIQASRLLESV